MTLTALRSLAVLLPIPALPALLLVGACNTPGASPETSSTVAPGGGSGGVSTTPLKTRLPNAGAFASRAARAATFRDSRAPSATGVAGAHAHETPPVADAGTTGPWQPLTPPTPTTTAGAIFLLTDGTVMLHDNSAASTWWRLKPDSSGNYATGTWTLAAPLPPGYAPTYFGAAVLADGTLIIVGGEYNRDGIIETAQAAIYDPVVDVWTPITTPSAWPAVGDAASVVLANGVFMVGSSETQDQALYDPRTQTWTITGAGKQNINAEEGFTLLPSGEVLDIDVVAPGGGPTTNSELYNPVTGVWSSAGSTVVQLGDPNAYEIGAAVLMANGNVFATGGTGHTALYLADGTWQAGPDFPTEPDAGALDVIDGPAALLPSGNVLCVGSPGDYNPPAFFFEFDGTNLNPVPVFPNAVNDPSFAINLLVLPSGQVLSTDFSPDLEIYTPTGAPNPAWAPTTTSVPSTLARGQTYVFSGTQFNGLSQASAYGDDFQNATNYPLVRITNNATGHVFYARTHDHSTMGVATGSATVSTEVDVPGGIETGASAVSVVANGIASAPVAVTIQ